MAIRIKFCLTRIKFCLTIFSFIVFFHSASATALEYKASDTTKVVLLGVGNPNPLPDRSGPATAIIVNGTAYIVDFGPGIVRRAAEAAEKYGLDALRAENLRYAFLTHLHSDHTIGFPDLLLTGWVMERQVPLKLFGPPGTKLFADTLVKAYHPDIENRLNGLQPRTEKGWMVETTEAMEGQIFRDDNVLVEVFPVCHGNWENAVGYKFTTPDRVIVISGDTTYCKKVEEMALGADILIHEVYSDESFKTLPANWAHYHAANHTSALDLARLAGNSRPGLLILHHQLVWGGDDYDLPRREIIALYDGRVVSGIDMQVY